jgi:hypothetical protein
LENKPISPERIFHAYGELFPSEFEFLVLYNLYINYSNSEIQYPDIKQAIVDTSRLPFISTGNDRQIERTFKGLLRTFIERAPSKSNSFILTPHAEKVIEIVTHRIHNPYLRFPLKETFETYFTLPESLNEINALQSWYKFGFLNNARQVVTSHLDGLKISVDEAIKEINKVLEADNLTAIQMLEEFSKNFQILGDKARQITEAIKMKVEVHYSLRDIVDSFFATNPASGQIGTQIKKDVFNFFEKIDKQLDIINMKMAYSSTKIAELHESLRVQSRYKINLKKMLAYLLENSRPEPQSWIELPEAFPPKGLVQERFRLRALRYYDTGFLKRTVPFEQKRDSDYEEKQRILFEQELKKQITAKKYYELLRKKLYDIGKIELSSELLEIIQETEDLEIGILIGYDIVENQGSNEVITIKEQLKSNSENKFHLWTMDIHLKQDLNS